MEDNSSFRLQKISMIVADVLLVATGIGIAFSGEGPMGPIQSLWVIACFVIGGTLAFIPFYLEFKVRVNLAEYDRSQADGESSRRIEHALAEMQEISAGVTQQADRSEQLSTRFEGLMSALDGKIQQDQEANAKLAKEKQDIAQAMTELREELTKVISDGPNAEDTAALIGGIEVALGNLSTQMESLQFFLAKEAAQRTTSTTATDDLTPETMTEGDEAVEPSTFIEDNEVDNIELSDDEDDTDAPSDDADKIAANDLASGNDEAVATDTILDEDEVIEEVSTENDDELADDFPEEEADQDEAEEDDANESDDILDIEGEAEESDADDAASEEEPPETSDEDDALEDDEALETADDDEDDTTQKLSSAKLEELDEFGDISMSAALPDDDTADEEPAVEDAEPDETDEEEAAPVPAQQDLMGDLPPPEKKKKSKKSANEATALVAQVLIGIGNKPYVRGTGPGLSEDEGVPMEFVEIGKWQWLAPESDAPIVCQIYKNDEVPADGDSIELEPGQRRTVNPTFSA